MTFKELPLHDLTDQEKQFLKDLRSDRARHLYEDQDYTIQEAKQEATDTMRWWQEQLEDGTLIFEGYREEQP